MAEWNISCCVFNSFARQVPSFLNANLRCQFLPKALLRLLLIITQKRRLSECPYMDRVKQIWYLSPMRAAKVQASLRIRAVSPEPPLLAHTSNESRGTFRQKAKSLARLNGWACAVKICHDGMLEDTNSLGGAQLYHFTASYVKKSEN